jgi:ABC-2 type transport system permease protein
MIRAGHIYFSVRGEQQFNLDQLPVAQIQELVRIGPSFYESFIRGRNPFYEAGFQLLIMVLFAGSGLIANDKKHKALTLYFSKPVTAADYITGKFLVILFYGLIITFIPAILLFLLRVLFDVSGVYFKTFYWIPFSITGAVLLNIFVYAGLIMALSAAASKARTAAIAFFSVLFVPDILRMIFSGIPSIGVISIWADLRQISAWMFGLDLPYAFSPWLALAFLLVLLFCCVLLLGKSIKPTEVVK